MRISTNIMFESGATRISELQSALLKTQQQISANRRVLTPADDPIAAARALDITQSQNLNTQYAKNRTFATDSLSMEENVLQSVTTMLQNIQTQVIEAGDAAYDDVQRGYLATELRGQFEELLGLANTRDTEGNYLFSGFQTATEAFSQTSSGVVYVGDQGQRSLQVGSVRQMSISDSGDAVFSRIPANKLFTSGLAVSNTGTGAVSALSITNRAQLTGHEYDVVFDVTAGVTTYSVVDTTSGATLSSANAYTTPQDITFDGLQITVSGAPVDGDTFTVREASAGATDAVVIQTGMQSIFDSIDDLISLLETPTTTSSTKQALTNGLAVANANVSNALDNVLTIRATVGARLNELESLDSAGEDRGLLYSQTLSQLQDLDYVKAISELTMQSTTLQAAQKSYLNIMDLSLFNYL